MPSRRVNTSRRSRAAAAVLGATLLAQTHCSLVNRHPDEKLTHEQVIEMIAANLPAHDIRASPRTDLGNLADIVHSVSAGPRAQDYGNATHHVLSALAAFRFSRHYPANPTKSHREAWIKLAQEIVANEADNLHNKKRDELGTSPSMDSISALSLERFQVAQSATARLRAEIARKKEFPKEFIITIGGESVRIVFSNHPTMRALNEVVTTCVDSQGEADSTGVAASFSNPATKAKPKHPFSRIWSSIRRGFS